MSAVDFEQRADQAAGASDFSAARQFLEDATRLEPGRLELWLKLSAMCRALHDDAAALASLDRALALDPYAFPALMMRATVLDALGERSKASLAFGHALAQAPANIPPQMQGVIEAARARYAGWQSEQANHLRAAVSAVTPLTPNLDRLITNAVHLTEMERNGPTHYSFPGLTEASFHDRARFPWLAALEAAADDIQSEFEAVVSAEAAELVPYIQYPENAPLEQWAALNQNRDWTAIHLLNRGVLNATNARHCPRTMAVLKSIPQPNIMGAGPNAMFSLLAPETHIPPHHGITDTRLVCHLPLIVPEGCWFRVGDERRDWERGQAWVFDDTIEHEAMNPSAALRVILIVDVWHPDLRAEEQAGVAAIIGAGGEVHGL